MTMMHRKFNLSQNITDLTNIDCLTTMKLVWLLAINQESEARNIRPKQGLVYPEHSIRQDQASSGEQWL